MEISQFNLRHLHAVAIVARTGSIAGSLEAVNLSQPALTQAIARLERQLDHTLFNRHPGGMAPTQAGVLLVMRVDRVLNYIARGIRAARRMARLPTNAAIERRITLPQLRALVAVDDGGSYSLAANRIGVSQPAVYRAMQELAEAMELALVARRGRTVQTTVAAARMLKFVRLALAELAAALDELAALRSQGAGRVSVGALPLARAILLPQTLARFARANPGASVNVVEGPYAELLTHLREGSLDILVGAMRDPPPVNDVCQEGLFDDDPVIVARAGHPLASGGFTFARLLDYPWVIAAQGAPVRARWERMFRDQQLEPPPLRIECGSVLITRGLLLEDDWLTLMSRDQFLFEQRAGLLCELGTAGPAVRRRIGLTTRADWHPTRLQADFVSTLRHVCGAREALPARWPFQHPDPRIRPHS